MTVPSTNAHGCGLDSVPIPFGGVHTVALLVDFRTSINLSAISFHHTGVWCIRWRAVPRAVSSGISLPRSLPITTRPSLASHIIWGGLNLSGHLHRSSSDSVKSQRCFIVVSPSSKPAMRRFSLLLHEYMSWRIIPTEKRMLGTKDTPSCFRALPKPPPTGQQLLRPA